MSNLKTKGLHFYWGVITSLVIIVLAILLYVLKLNVFPGLQIGILVGTVISGIYSSCKEFQKLNKEADSKELFFNGFRTTAIISLILIAFGLLMLLIFPGIKQNMIEQYQNELIKNNTTDIAESVAQYKRRFTTLFIGLNLMPVVLAGLVGSFLISIFLKRK